MTSGGGINDLARQFVALNDHLHAEGDRDAALQRLVELAVQSVPGCDWAALTAWPPHRNPLTLATSADVAAAVERLQYDIGDGPCLSAAAAVGDGEAMLIDDVADATHWPEFAAAARTRTPVRAVLSLHLTDAPQRAALNLYSAAAGAFNGPAFTVAALFAAHARVVLTHAASADKAAHLQRALSTSRQISTAIGILMNAHKITSDQALDLLLDSSQHLHRKLPDIADTVTLTGALPERR